MKQAKRPWHLWVFALFMLFLYSMGIYDYFMMLSHNAGYYASKGFGAGVEVYFTNYPLYFMVFLIGNLICGFTAPLLLIFRKKQAAILALISAVSDAVLIILTSLFRNRIEVLGVPIFMFDLFILLITFLLYVYCRSVNRKTERL